MKERHVFIHSLSAIFCIALLCMTLLSGCGTTQEENLTLADTSNEEQSEENQEEHRFDGVYVLESIETSGKRSEPARGISSDLTVELNGSSVSSQLWMFRDDDSSLIVGYVEDYKEENDYHQYIFNITLVEGNLIKVKVGDSFYLYHYPQKDEVRMEAGSMTYWYTYSSGKKGENDQISLDTISSEVETPSYDEDGPTLESWLVERNGMDKLLENDGVDEVKGNTMYMSGTLDYDSAEIASLSMEDEAVSSLYQTLGEAESSFCELITSVENSTGISGVLVDLTLCDNAGRKIFWASFNADGAYDSKPLGYFADSKSGGKSSSESSSGSGSGSSSFTNAYGTPTTRCAHSGCSNYIASSGDTNCCTKHSNKCLECGKYIDEDATWCMDCLTKSVNNSSGYSGSSGSSSGGSSTEKYPCMGKHDTCPNYTYDPYDFFCSSCDPDGDNVEG